MIWIRAVERGLMAMAVADFSRWPGLFGAIGGIGAGGTVPFAG